MLFFFSISNQLILLVNRQTWDKKRKKGVTGRGYIGGGYCHVHHVVLFISLSWLLFLLQKQCRAIVWWHCFLIDWRMQGLLMTGEGLWDCGNRVLCDCVCVTVCMCWCYIRRASMCVYVWARTSWMRGFTSVPLSLWGQVPSTLIQAYPCGGLHLQNQRKRQSDRFIHRFDVL